MELPAKQHCQSSPFTSNLGQIGPNWQCCLAGSSKTAPRIFSIVLGAEYLSYVKSIAPTFFGCIISVLASVKSHLTNFPFFKFQLKTLIATSCIKDMYVIDGMDVSSDAVMAIEALFLLISSEGSLQRDSYSSRKVCFCSIYFLPNHNMCSFTFRHLKKFSLIQVLKECLLCVVQLCRVHPRTSDQFVDIVGGLLLTTSRETVSTFSCQITMYWFYI